MSLPFAADLHIHSKYSRATSKDCDLEHLAMWGARKGIAVIGTGDFTHPAWRAELEEKLVPAEPGLFRLQPELERAALERAGVASAAVPRFQLSVEISTIYKKDERTRKVHHLVYAPNLEEAREVSARLARIGNLNADGRPILGLDSRHLLEIVLESGGAAGGSYLVPAHVWTPWFAALGSRSGFDDVAHCYGDLAEHIFAVETGLSSDPAMNWRLSSLDRYRLVSNSDAHSPAKLGREVTLFGCELDYFAMRRALESGDGFGGTLEFFPEEGKYHLDGHRKCNVVLEPEETRARGGVCPSCEKPLTVGVMSRVEELADRPAGFRPPGAADYRCLVPLPEILSELYDSGPSSKLVNRAYDRVIAGVGAELFTLESAPLEDLERQSAHLAEAIRRLRAGEVIRQAGYDGEYGVIRLFRPDELTAMRNPILPGFSPALALVAEDSDSRTHIRDSEDGQMQGSTRTGPEPTPVGEDRKRSADAADGHRSISDMRSAWCPHLAPLDPSQRRAAALISRPLLIVAGPGTGKTRTLTHRIAHLIGCGGAAPAHCLAITFTNRAAQELRERLAALSVGDVPVTTFHGLAYAILREYHQQAGLPRGLRIATPERCEDVLMAQRSCTRSQARKLLATRIGPDDAAKADAAADIAHARVLLAEELERAGELSFDDLILRAVALLEQDDEVRTALRRRHRYVSIDEYQDIDPQQYRMVRALCPQSGNLCAIGDPDQSIYGFRGASVELFLRFDQDYPKADRVELAQNYRCAPAILNGALQAIAPSTLVPDRVLHAVSTSRARIQVGSHSSAAAEAAYVVHNIEQRMGGLAFFSFDSDRVGDPSAATELGFSDFAVLYRTAAQAEALATALARSGMPFQVRSHQPLLEDATAARLLARVFAGPPDASLVMRIRDAAGAEASSAAPDSDGAALDRARDALLALAQRHPEAEDFFAATALASDADAWDARADRVSLLTLHASKGLEFRVVFLVGCELGLLPLERDRPAEPGELEEERRLFFVGMTRARDELHLTHCRQRLWRGALREAAPSPFLDVVDEMLLAHTLSSPPPKPPRASQLSLF